MSDEMNRTTAVGYAVMLAVVLLAVHPLGNLALAEPITYSFSTGATPFGGPTVVDGPFPPPSLFVGGASGTFTYDSSALPAVTNPDGSITYRGFTPASVTGFVTATSGLGGIVAGLSFSDVGGIAQVGNGTFLPPFGSQKVDFFQLAFDPFPGSTSPRNLTGFSIAGFTLVNVRMFWIEGQQTPETIPEFLSDENLPAALPSFHGRIAFDFVPTNDLSGPLSGVFFDELSVRPAAAIPEPEAFVLLLAGVALLWTLSRRWGRSARSLVAAHPGRRCHFTRSRIQSPGDLIHPGGDRAECDLADAH